MHIIIKYTDSNQNSRDPAELKNSRTPDSTQKDLWERSEQKSF